MYLEPIFSSEDIKAKMPKDYVKFVQIDKSWRQNMDQFHKDVNYYYYYYIIYNYKFTAVHLGANRQRQAAAGVQDQQQSARGDPEKSGPVPEHKEEVLP